MQFRIIYRLALEKGIGESQLQQEQQDMRRDEHGLFQIQTLRSHPDIISGCTNNNEYVKAIKYYVGDYANMTVNRNRISSGCLHPRGPRVSPPNTNMIK